MANNHYWPSTSEIGEVFAEEVAEIGGTVSDRYDSGTLLLARSILPGLREVGRDDKVQGGVAIRATEAGIRVHPYLFRQICSNGAIMAQAVQTWQLARDQDTSFAGEGPLAELREAIRACASDEAFAASADRMRSSREIQADLELSLMSLIGRLPREVADQVLGPILDRFIEEADDSRFGLMNAVTSVARDTRDPRLRWRLEELGGGIPIAVKAPRPTLGPAKAELLPA
jgi:hypothetical protein